MQLYALNLPAQITPFPIYPLLQTQVKLPSVFVQFAKAWQLWVFVEHSSISKRFQYFENLLQL